MKRVKGKCKKCFGCNRLDDENFEGVKKCRNYTKANEKNWYLLIVSIVELLSIGFFIYEFFEFLSMLCGG